MLHNKLRRSAAMLLVFAGVISANYMQAAAAATLTSGDAVTGILNCTSPDPLVSVQDNCIVFVFNSQSETMSNGGSSINLPPGITVTKKMSIGPNYSTCNWSGKFGVTANSKGGSTLTVNGISCSTHGELDIAFYAKIATPTQFATCPGVEDPPTALMTATYWNTKSTPTKSTRNTLIPLWVVTVPSFFCLS